MVKANDSVTLVRVNDGAKGAIGPKGDTGATGPQGPKGATGATGQPGADAIALTISSSNGALFKNEAIDTMLTAYIFKGSSEMSASAISALGTIKWYTDDNTVAATGKTYHVTGSSGASIHVEARLENGTRIIAIGSADLASVMDGETGATGATGAQGPRGEAGKPGDDGIGLSSAQPYYRLASSMPSRPSGSTPDDVWSTTEPTYTQGSSMRLYETVRLAWSDGTVTYTPVTMSSSYEAARDAYNRAVEASKTATSYMSSDSTGVMIADMTGSGTPSKPAEIQSGFNTRVTPSAFQVRNGQNVLSSFGREVTMGSRRDVDPGDSSTAIGEGSFAAGNDLSASGYYAHAEGREGYASGYYAHAEGYQPVAAGYASHAEGSGTTSRGDEAHAEGIGSSSRTATLDVHFTGAAGATEYAVEDRADQLALLEIGYQPWFTTVLILSITYGDLTVTPVAWGHSFDGTTSYRFRVSKTLSANQALSNAPVTFTYFTHGAMAAGAHSEGEMTLASAQGAHAQGIRTMAAGRDSFATGRSTIARGVDEFVHGRYNVKPSQSEDFAGDKYEEVVGNGTGEDTRSNARTLDWAGNEWLAGKLTAQGGIKTPGDVEGATFNGNALDTASLSKIGSWGIWSGTYVTQAWKPGSFSGGQYTAPRSGLYLVIMECQLNSMKGKYIQLQLHKNNAFDSILFYQESCNVIRTFEPKAVHCNAGDKLGVYIHTGSANVSVPLVTQVIFLGNAS